MYLAEKFGEFVPTEPPLVPNASRGCSGKSAACPISVAALATSMPTLRRRIEYKIDWFTMETKRQLDVLDRRLAESKYIAGDTYTIADMAIFPWYGWLVKGWLYGGGEFLSVQDYKNVTAGLTNCRAVRR